MFSQKGIFATTIRITTNITSFDIDLLVYDGLIASYISNVILKSPYCFSLSLILVNLIESIYYGVLVSNLSVQLLVVMMCT